MTALCGKWIYKKLSIPQKLFFFKEMASLTEFFFFLLFNCEMFHVCRKVYKIRVGTNLKYIAV